MLKANALENSAKSPDPGSTTRILLQTRQACSVPQQTSISFVGPQMVRRSISKSLFVSAVLSLICILISPVLSTDALWNVISANTASNPDTTMAGLSQYPVYGRVATGPGYLYSLRDYGAVMAPGIYIFNHVALPNSANLRRGTLNARDLQTVDTVVLTEAKTMYAGGTAGVTNLQIHNMAYDTGTGLYSQTNWVTNAGIRIVHKLLYEDGATSYLYYFIFPEARGFKWDTTGPLPTSFVQVSANVAFSAQKYDSTYIIHWGWNSENIQFLNKATMVVDTTLTGTGVQAYLFTIDNLAANTLYAFQNGIPYGLSKVLMTATTSTVTGTIPSSVILLSNILNFGPYQYIGLVRSNPTPVSMRMYSKASLAEVATTVFVAAPTAGYGQYSLVQGPSEGNKFFLAYQVNPGVNNFQSYYIQFDLCTTRSGSGQHDPTGTCSACPANYYLSQTGVPGNQCYPNGWGINTDPLTLVPCADTNCLECPTSSTICRKCTQTPTKYWSQGTDPTTCVTTPPASRFGIDATEFLYVACSDSNCLNCAASNTVCTGCDVTGGWYLNGTTCIRTTQFAVNQGINTTAGTVVTCASANCINCTNNFAVCTACNVSAGFYLFNAGCINTSSFTPSQGIRASDGTVQTCASANCVNCVSNFAVCTACNVSAGFYLFNAGCINTSSFTPSQGIRASDGTVQTCASANCVNCVSNFAVCTACNVSAGFYLFNAGCINTSSFTPSQGIRASDGTVQTCASANCVNCVSNFAVCTACNVSAGFYLFNAGCISTPMFTTNQGIRSSDGSVQNCTDPNCVNCVSNFSACAACNTSGGWYLLGVSCLRNTSFAPNQGAGLLDGRVYNCADTNCIDCVADYTKCTSCNTSASFYRNGTVCISLGVLAPWEGIDPTTGVVRNCSDVNCVNCKANYLVCVACNTTNDWYLSGSICRNPSTFAPNEGIRASNGTVANCIDTRCVDCKRNISNCIACDTGNGWYLDGLICKNTPMFTIKQGISAGDGLVKYCTDLNCVNCTLDYATCRACDTASGWFRNTTTSTCQQNTTFGPNQGARPADGTVQFCSDLYCTNCISDHSRCNRCNTTKGYYLLGTNCINASSLGTGQGINSALGTVVACQDANCLSCKLDYQVCTACNVAADFYLDAGKCLSKKDIKPRQGIDPTDGTIKNCSDPHCINCLNNYQICTECDQANGYIVETSNSTCKPKALESTLVFLVFKAARISKAAVDLAYHAMVDNTTVLDPKLIRQIYKSLQYQGRVSVNFMSRSNPGQMTSGDTTLTVEAGATSAVINIKFNTYLPDKDYDVYIKSESALNLTFEGSNYTVYPAEGTFDYTNPIDKSQAETLYTLFGGFSTLASLGGTSSSKSASITLALLALDPTGTFFRFTKILQIVNKLYFININYGKRLEAFLAKSAYAIKDDKRTQVYHSTSTRGKLTAQMVPLDILSEGNRWKFILYWVSGFIGVITLVLRKYTDAGYRKWMLYFCHYANKVHLVIFNLVFIDFIWLAPRTLLHSHNLSVFRYIAALLTATLIFADSRRLYQSVPLAWRWKINKKAGRWPDLDLKEVTSDPSDTNQPQTKQINYKKTYFEIDFNVHLMNWCDYVNITKIKSTESWILVVLNLGAFTRPTAFLLITVFTQYAALLGITLYFVYEMVRFFATIYAYLKYKYLKNIICLLMEVSQSIFMIAFTSLALLISPKRFDEPVIDFYQDAGIWIVIASCVAEYLLLITYITVAAYEFIKNRNMMKKMNVKLSPVSFTKPSESHSEEDPFSRVDHKTRSTFFSAFGPLHLGASGLFGTRKRGTTKPGKVGPFDTSTKNKFYNRPTHYFASRLKAANSNSARSLIGEK